MTKLTTTLVACAAVAMILPGCATKKYARTQVSDSEARIGERLDPGETLETLRSLHEDDTSLPVPSGPNSGLSVRVVR